MDDNIISIIIGGVIAIVSGAVSHILSNYFKLKSERKKYVFEKLEDIIHSISNIEQMIQKDFAGIFKLLNPSENNQEINLSYEQNKLECLVKIYHTKLSKSVDRFNRSIRKYQLAKVEIINKEREKDSEEEIIKKAYQKLSRIFKECTDEATLFIDDLTKYGNKKVS